MKKYVIQGTIDTNSVWIPFPSIDDSMAYMESLGYMVSKGSINALSIKLVCDNHDEDNGVLAEFDFPTVLQ